MTRSNAPAYMTGFGNHFATEAAPGALPVGQNSPQKTPMGLYAEQLSGTAFTAHMPERTWCYRIRPSVKHVGRFAPIEVPHWRIIAATSLAGVRGAITLAGVLTLPLVSLDGTPFPARELAIFLAMGQVQTDEAYLRESLSRDGEARFTRFSDRAVDGRMPEMRG